jgi:hypothetical protein
MERKRRCMSNVVRKGREAAATFDSHGNCTISKLYLGSGYKKIIYSG